MIAVLQWCFRTIIIVLKLTSVVKLECSCFPIGRHFLFFDLAVIGNRDTTMCALIGQAVIQLPSSDPVAKQWSSCQAVIQLPSSDPVAKQWSSCQAVQEQVFPSSCTSLVGVWLPINSAHLKYEQLYGTQISRDPSFHCNIIFKHKNSVSPIWYTGDRLCHTR